ncbi:hypothetical protein Gohar_027220 [Gossypium harknessii]|uniref:Myb/SANT-like domain-containing protein n=1 Tax=Gossypium harknessii TaxID=34285 RepID=A0A7J9HU13_9ROSI|nr:hypothetical protein [Gossypium harknessii]
MAGQEVNFENETSSSKSIRRHWINEQDRILVQFLVELYHIGNHNANCGFRKGYLPHTGDFGWDSTRKVVTVEQAVWDEFLKSYKNAAPFKNRALPYFEDFSMIYDKDGATGKDAQTTTNVIEELKEDKDDNGGTENNANGTSVGE